MTTDYNFSLDVRIPFESARQSSIARESLKPDPVLKPQELKIQYETMDKELMIHFRSTSDRVLRVGVNSTLESLKTVIECMDEFDGKKDQVLEI